MNLKFIVIAILVTLISCSKNSNTRDLENRADSNDPNTLRQVIATTETQLQQMSCRFLEEDINTAADKGVSTAVSPRRQMFIECGRRLVDIYPTIDLLAIYTKAVNNLIPHMVSDPKQEVLLLQSKGDATAKFHAELVPYLDFKDLAMNIVSHENQLSQMGWPIRDNNPNLTDEEFKKLFEPINNDPNKQVITQAVPIFKEICAEAKTAWENSETKKQNEQGSFPILITERVQFACWFPTTQN